MRISDWSSDVCSSDLIDRATDNSVGMMERFSSCRAFWSQRASVPLGSGETDMRKIVGLAFLATMFMVSACNTVEGMGKDVSSAGDTVAGTADDAKIGRAHV